MCEIDYEFFKVKIRTEEEYDVIEVYEKVTGKNLAFALKMNCEIVSPMEQWESIFRMMNRLWGNIERQYEGDV